MAKGIPMRRFRPVLWGDPRHGRFGAERLGRPVGFVGRMEGAGHGRGPKGVYGGLGSRGSCQTPGDRMDLMGEPWRAIVGAVWASLLSQR